MTEAPNPLSALSPPAAAADLVSLDVERAQPSLVSRTLARWSQALREIAASAMLPFGGGDGTDLPADQAGHLGAQMRACLAARGGEVLARAQAASIASVYLGLSATGRARFFDLLAQEFGVDRAEVDQAIERFRAAADEPERLNAERALRRALVTPGMRLLTKFNALPEGMRFLVDMRADLLALQSQDPRLRALDEDFRHLLATWCDVGFLTRQRLTWDSAAALLEKIIEYEAVHEIRSWSDLRHRLDGDRRCYAFFHPSLPKEPLIFLQVALVEGLAGRIEPLLDEEGPGLDPERADTAIFYSITNTLYGLRGISFGNFLIKQVVDDLAHDLPNLKQFATLSPLPGLLAWLGQQPEDAWLEPEERRALAALPGESGLAEALGRGDWVGQPDLAGALEPALVRAAARYLVERDRAGLPLDPVARFHLGNGARIERLNWLADGSSRRLRQSAGIMANYLYHPAEIEPNHEAYASRRLITVAPEINDLLRGAPDEVAALVRVSRRGGRLGRMIGRA
ncbi:MAG TPA: malonyl-CoA decarboxylase [Geminicoccaceae bacterium]|nr:malonyl-CoA decarboxylase [Geminicoccaceae bacterium]